MISRAGMEDVQHIGMFASAENGQQSTYRALGVKIAIKIPVHQATGRHLSLRCTQVANRASLDYAYGPPLTTEIVR